MSACPTHLICREIIDVKIFYVLYVFKMTLNSPNEISLLSRRTFSSGNRQFVTRLQCFVFVYFKIFNPRRKPCQIFYRHTF